MTFRFSRTFFFVTLLFAMPFFASAASLRLSPASGTYNVGQTLSVSILVNSNNRAMNAVAGVISFPSNLLEVRSLSKGGTIMSLWVKEPSYSNSNGTVNFEGVVLNPGFTGTAGNVITIVFKVKAPGTAQVGFEGAQVLANDGTGADILSGSESAEFTLTEGGVVPSIETPVGGLVVKEMPREKVFPEVTFLIKVTDKTFDLDHFTLTLNKGASKDVPPTKDGLYKIAQGELNTNMLLVRAVSAGGAFLEKSTTFFIEGLEPPVMTEYPQSTDGRKPISIKGTTKYSKATLTLLMRQDGKEVIRETLSTDGDGNFTYLNPHELVNGEYIVTAYVTRDDKARSFESSPVTITVSSPFIVYLGTLAINIFFAVLILLLILLLLASITLYIYYRYRAYKKNVRRETAEAEESLKKSIKLLKEDITDTFGDAKGANELKKDVENIGRLVGKEIDDIEKLR